jgi:hypothetical protein
MADANIEPERGRKIAFRASPEIIAEIEPSRRLRVYPPRGHSRPGARQTAGARLMAYPSLAASGHLAGLPSPNYGQ